MEGGVAGQLCGVVESAVSSLCEPTEVQVGETEDVGLEMDVFSLLMSMFTFRDDWLLSLTEISVRHHFT